MTTHRDEIRRILLKILTPPDQEPTPKCVGFLGIQGGEGCTSVMSELARELAMRPGASLVAVDTCLERPALHGHFGLESAPGVLDVLRHETELDQAVRPAAYGASGASGALSVLPLGSAGVDGSAEFTQDAIAGLLDALRPRYAHVLVDVGPFGDGPVPIAVTSALDAVVVVVRSEVTRIIAAERVLDEVRRTQPRILGVVLNRRRRWLPDWLYRRL